MEVRSDCLPSPFNQPLIVGSGTHNRSSPDNPLHDKFVRQFGYIAARTAAFVFAASWGNTLDTWLLQELRHQFNPRIKK